MAPSKIALFIREDSCEKTFGKGSPRCQKPTSSQAVPISLGVCIPLGIAIIALCYLHYRHVKKLKREEIENQNIDVDVDMDDISVHHDFSDKQDQHKEKTFSQYEDDGFDLRPPLRHADSYRTASSGERAASITGSINSSSHPENPFYSSAPYALPAENTSSKHSIDEYSKSINSIYDASTSAYPQSIYGGILPAPYSPTSTSSSRTNSAVKSERPPFRAPPQLRQAASASKTSLLTVTQQQQHEHLSKDIAENHGLASNDDTASSRLSFASAQSHSYNISSSLTPPSSANSPISGSAPELHSETITLKSSPRKNEDAAVAASNDYRRNSLPSLHSLGSENGRDTAGDPSALGVGAARSTTERNSLVSSAGQPSFQRDSVGSVDSDESDSESMKNRHLSYKDISKAETEDFSFDKSENNSSGNAGTADFVFGETTIPGDGVDYEQADLNRSDTKHFERVKSIYREYMDSEEEEEEEGEEKEKEQEQQPPYDRHVEPLNSARELTREDRDDPSRFSWNQPQDYNQDHKHEMPYSNREYDRSYESYHSADHLNQTVGSLAPDSSFSSSVSVNSPHETAPLSLPGPNSQHHTPHLSMYQESVYDNRSMADDTSVYYPPPPTRPGRSDSFASQPSHYSANTNYSGYNNEPAGTTGANGAPPPPPIPRNVPKSAPPKPLPKLKTLPNPSNLGDDSVAVLFAPKQRRKAPHQIQLPAQAQAAVPPRSPTIGSPTLPSPHAFVNGNDSILGNLDFAPPKKYSAGDSRSNSLNKSSGGGSIPGSPLTQQSGQSGWGQHQSYETRPPSTLVPGVDDSEMLRPKMEMR